MAIRTIKKPRQKTAARLNVIRSGEWVEPVLRGYLLECCDCGLVHRMNFRTRNGQIQFQLFRLKKRWKMEGVTQGAKRKR